MEINELEKLAQDLYLEGYQCGISDDRWFRAYAMAMQRVAAGSKYTDDLVNECFLELGKKSYGKQS